MAQNSKTFGDMTVVQLPSAAFLFADIVGFTAFTERHGDGAGAELAWRLRLGVERQLGADAHVIKTVGDAVMVRLADGGEAAAAGLQIVARALPGDADPPVRVGIHCGRAVECDGDFFGAAVNVAARVVSLAGPGEVLMTDAAADAARRQGLALHARGERRLRNVTCPVSLYALAPRPTPAGRGQRRRCAPRRRHQGASLPTTPAVAHVQL